MNEYIFDILQGSAIILSAGGFLIHRYRKTILRSNIKTFLTLLACGFTSAAVPWSIFGVFLGLVPILLSTGAIYFWHEKYGPLNWIKTFLAIVGFATVSSFFTGGILCGLSVFEYAWQSILLASILATFLLAKRKKK